MNFVTDHFSGGAYKILFLLLIAFVLAPFGRRIVAVLRVNRLALPTLHQLLPAQDRVTLVNCLGQNMGNGAVPAEAVRDETTQRILAMMGNQAWQDGECEDASQYWERALSLDNFDNPTRFHLGMSYYLMGHPEKAGALLTQLNSGSMEKLLEVITRFGFNKGDLEQLNWLKIAFWVYPSRTAMRRLDKTLTPMGRTDEVDFYYMKLVELAPADTFDHWWADGQLAGRNQEWEQALSSYRTGFSHAAGPEEMYRLFKGASLSSRMLGDLDCANYFQSLAEFPAKVDSSQFECPY
jgi:tetratricopeptide (TPR) repeat protein